MAKAIRTFAGKYRIKSPRLSSELRPNIQFRHRSQRFDLHQIPSIGMRKLYSNIGQAGNWIHWIVTMRIRSAANILMLIGSLAFIAGSAVSQTCDSLLGGANCGARPQASQQNGRIPPSYGPQGNTDWRLGSGSATGGIGSGLSSRDDQPATFGAITFGGSGRTCSGPFRSRDC